MWSPWLVLGLLAGAVIDRVPPRPLMVGCDLLAALAYGSVPVAAAAGVLGIGQLLVVAFVAGAVDVWSQATRQSYPPRIVAAEQLPAADSALATASSATDVAAAPLSGVIVHALGAVAGVAADAVSFAASAALLAASRPGAAGERVERDEPEPGPAPSRVGALRDEVVEGLHLVARDPWLSRLAVGAGLANLVLTGVGSLQALLLLRTVGVPPGLVGPLLVGEGVGGLAGAALATRLAGRVGSARAVAGLAVAGPVAGLAVAFTGPGAGLAWFVLGTTGSTAAVVGGNVLTVVFRHRYVPAAMLGRVGASMRVAAYAAAPLGALLAGGLAAAVGTRAAVTALLGLGLVRGLLFLGRPWRGARDLPTGPLAAAGAGAAQ